MKKHYNYTERHTCLLSVAVFNELHRFYRDFHPFEDTTLKQKNWQNLFWNVKMTVDSCVRLCEQSSSLARMYSACWRACVCACAIREKKVTENMRNRETARLRVEAADAFVHEQSWNQSQFQKQTKSIEKDCADESQPLFSVHVVAVFFFLFFLVGAMLVLSWLCPFCLSDGASRENISQPCCIIPIWPAEKWRVSWRGLTPPTSPLWCTTLCTAETV